MAIDDVAKDSMSRHATTIDCVTADNTIRDRQTCDVQVKKESSLGLYEVYKTSEADLMPDYLNPYEFITREAHVGDKKLDYVNMHELESNNNPLICEGLLK